jgi:alpha-L-rhamnosidase
VQQHVREDGLLMGWPDEPYRNWYLGDWAKPLRNERDEERSTHLINNCVIIQCTDRMARIADDLGRPDEAAAYRTRAAALRDATHAEFWRPDAGTYADDTQLDLGYALLVDLPPAALRPAVLARLETKILEEHDGHLDVGLVGVPILTESLMKAGRNDLVFSYVNQTDFPGWGHMLANGATTTWEHWNGGRSHIHNCFNSLGPWFYQALAGIRPAAPGYARVLLKPEPAGDVRWVKARQETPRGPVESVWRIAEGRFEWEVRVPPNATAEVHVPTADPKAVLESGGPAQAAEGLRYERAADGHAVYTASAGRYRFSAPYAPAP